MADKRTRSTAAEIARGLAARNAGATDDGPGGSRPNALVDESVPESLLAHAKHASGRSKKDQQLSVQERMAWATVQGLLVPVIGTGVSTRGSLAGSTVQSTEREAADNARLRLQRLINASREGLAPKFTPQGPDVTALFWPDAAKMLDNMCDNVYGPTRGGSGCRSVPDANRQVDLPSTPGPASPSLEELVVGETDDPALRSLLRLQLCIARTLAAATRIWASGLRKNPHAFGPLFVDEGTPLTLESVWNPGELEAFWIAVLDGLNAARDLCDNCDWDPNSPVDRLLDSVSHDRTGPIKDVAGVLRPELIYVRLLQFVGETGTAGSPMWEYRRPQGLRWHQEFTSNHMQAIRALRTNKIQTLMVPSGQTTNPPPVSFRLTDHGTLRRRHLEWLASLLQHTFVAPTQAYRNRAELAFSVSLDIPPERTSHLPLRAWDLRETELSWPPQPLNTQRFTDAIRNALGRSCYLETGLREPSKFICALARLVCWSASEAAKGSSFVQTGIASGLVLTTALDLEMETALSSLGPHRVLAPVWIEDQSEETRVPGWLLARWPRATGDSPYDPLQPESWSLVDSGPQVTLPIDTSGQSAWSVLGEGDFAHDQGPLVVKLEGSPLHDPKKWVENAENPVVRMSKRRDLQPLQKLIDSRLPLGEADLFQFLRGALPEGQDKLYEKLAKGTLVFFGHDALQWGDRAHHFGISHAHAPGDAPKDDRRAFTAVSIRPRDGLADDDGVFALERRMGVEPLEESGTEASSLEAVAKKIIELACGEGET